MASSSVQKGNFVETYLPKQ